MNLIEHLKCYRRNKFAKKVLLHDVELYKGQYSSSMENEKYGKRAAKEILIYSHVIEKGLSHMTIKPLFGYDRVLLLNEALRKYISRGGDDKYILGIAVSSIEKYNEVNKSLGVGSNKLIKLPDISHLEPIIRLNVGATLYSKKSYFAHSNSGFESIATSRHSIRLYDYKSEPITEDEIIECIRIAQNCPSACNRQSVRIKIITDDNLIKEICRIQGGSNGFGENSGALLIITTDLSLYQPDERRIPMLDCGLFIMNLLYSFFDRKIGSCVLNGSFSINRENEMRRIISIPKNEAYAAIIALSKIPDNENVIVANSPKRSVFDIITIINGDNLTLGK